jgi:four helix bundle protein
MVKLYKYLQVDKKEYIMSKQLMRSGTSVGAMVREAEHSESKKDFIHKMAIAQKEINESIYWLELLEATEYINKEQFKDLNNDAVEVIKIITTIVKNTKKNMK